MQDNLTICKRCGGNAAYEVETPEFKHTLCYGCGFSSNSFWDESNPELVTTIPELYKALKFEDKDGKYWYPTTINHKTKGMIFADGTGIIDWKWVAVLAEAIPKKDKYKFKPGQTHKVNMATKKEFAQTDFMDALEFIGYFK